MTLQSAIDAALPELRREAEARMKSRATVRRGGARAEDADGFESSGWANVHTDLPFRYVGKSTRSVVIGGVEFQEATGRADFPHDTTDLEDNDVIEVTAGEWEGTFLRIVEAVKGDQQTARRVPVVEVEKPAGW